MLRILTVIIVVGGVIGIAAAEPLVSLSVSYRSDIIILRYTIYLQIFI